jgi:Ca2+-transporting ATPase
LLEAATLASRDQPEASGTDRTVRVDPVDRAMLRAAHQVGIDRRDLETAWPEAGLIPFSSERKWMATFHRSGSELTAFVKGAPATVLALCASVAGSDADTALDPAGQEHQLQINEQLAGEGLRVLAVARGPVTDAQASAIGGLTLLGFVGLADPPAAGVKETIAQLRQAGLRTIMLTGDQRLTAEAVGRELGVIEPGSSAIDGRELDRLDAGAVDEAVARHAVFSRITPEHKLVIVRALKARGEIVAMLGDGVNDAAALKQADVGVAMGIRGTDVAKQAASIVLQDDRFETVAAAVEEGRVIYDNIRKFVFYLFTCNVSEVAVLLVASLAGWPLPLVPLQLLWINLVTDTFPALALSLEPGGPDVMTRPPRRPDEEMLSRAFFARVLAYAALLTAVILAAYLWALAHAPERARTMAFMTMVFAEIAQLGSARQRGAVLALRAVVSNPFALGGAGLSIVLQILAYNLPPLASLLHVTALDLREWVIVLGLAAAPAILVQGIKVVTEIRAKGRGQRAKGT